MKLNGSEILSALPQHIVESLSLEIFDTIPSTNQYLLDKSVVADKVEICLAESQSAGRGRQQKPWFSPEGKNIYFSMKWLPLLFTEFSLSLSLVVGLSVQQVIQHYLAGKATVQLKWPNDVIVNDQKISGILVESTINQTAFSPVIGIGINVNMSEDGQTINQPWTSVKKWLNENSNRNALIALLIQTLFLNITQWQAAGFGPFKSAWKECDYLLGKKVSYFSFEGDRELKKTGVAHGVSDRGELLIEKDGKLTAINAGEVSTVRQI